MSSRMRAGVSPLSWTNDVLEDFGADIALETCLRQAAQAGYQGIELGRKFPRTVAALTPLLQAVGLQLASGWYSGFLAQRTTEEELEAVAPHAHLLQALGVKVMVYGECGRMPGEAPLDQPMSLSPPLSLLDLSDYASKMNAFSAALQREYGLQLAYHHHLMMLVERHGELQDFLAHTDDCVGLVLDTGHAFAGGVEITTLLKEYGRRIVHIHLKDVRPEVLQRVHDEDLSFNEAVRAGLFTIPGEGAIDYAPLIEFVENSGYQGWLIIEAEQDPQQAEPFTTVCRAFRWLQQTFMTEETTK
ncbi:myo-inosose-2 dehydratase [Erwinia endophytica]|uniref:myo-inosose-2 dehydratase n=1 Tax=Erwinia endophytica TaxID=1563158 RepID=UPI001265FABA|nr:myo-inosose-2 dehydratase [Erwinia endophytica]KAB8312866.1 myo-inosose-2 dehydratase [Erwinia endophytica]